LNDSSTIDTILAENSISVLQPSYPSVTSKNTEKDEKAISEIYETLVRSFNPGKTGILPMFSMISKRTVCIAGPTSLDLPLNNNPFSKISNMTVTRPDDQRLFHLDSLAGDLLFADTHSNGVPPNRTASMMDSMMPNYRATSNMYNYSTAQSQSVSSSLTILHIVTAHTHPRLLLLQAPPFSDCLSMDSMDNNNPFPPNVSLSPINNSFHPSSNMSSMDTNSIMMFPTQTPNHIQHHPPSNSIAPAYYRQSTQPTPVQSPIYNNNYAAPPNQVAPNYYPPSQQQRMSPANPTSAMNKRSGMVAASHPNQPNNQQLQFQMSLNVTVPHVSICTSGADCHLTRAIDFFPLLLLLQMQSNASKPTAAAQSVNQRRKHDSDLYDHFMPFLF
jgi:hypothetical protein